MSEHREEVFATASQMTGEHCFGDLEHSSSRFCILFVNGVWRTRWRACWVLKGKFAVFVPCASKGRCGILFPVWETGRNPSSHVDLTTAGNCYILEVGKKSRRAFRVRRLVLFPTGCSRPPAGDQAAHPDFFKRNGAIFMNMLNLMVRIPWRGCGVALCFVAGAYLIWGALWTSGTSKNLHGWIMRNGDSELKNAYAKLGSEKERLVLEASCRCYEARFGKGAWIEHFKKDAKKPCYADLVEAAIGLDQAENREEFLVSHVPAYEACLEAGLMDEAQSYGATIKELNAKGGRDWMVVSKNAFAVCVYQALREKPKLWEWYVGHESWVDAFLMTVTPEDGKLEDIVQLLKDNEQTFQRFHEEISKLSEEELQELADAEDIDEGRLVCYRSCLPFIAQYGDVLPPLVQEKVPMIEAMAVVANSIDAFTFDTSASCRAAGRELAALHRFHTSIWDLAAEEDCGVGVVRLYRDVPTWGEQVLNAYGRQHVANFIYSFCAPNEEKQLSAVSVAVVAETLAKCQEPGWAVLRTYRDNRQFRTMLAQHGFRLIPYLLKEGEEKTFTTLWNYPRELDECFDKDGKLKRQHVSWYEMSPIGGDLATVLKKWAKGRPVTMGEIGWAVFDVADAAMMVGSLGMSKIATAGGKGAAKQLAKRTVRQAEKRIAREMAEKTAKQITTKAVAKAGKGQIAKSTFKKTMRSGLRMMKRMGRASAKVLKAGKSVPRTIKNWSGKTWTNLRKVSPDTWKKCYKASQALMWIGFAHKVQAKGADFIQGALEDVGETAGKMGRALAAGVGNGITNAIKAALGIPKESGVGWARILQVIVGGGFILFSLWCLSGVHRSRALVVKKI